MSSLLQWVLANVVGLGPGVVEIWSALEDVRQTYLGF
jgi:hypothetical protein